MLDGGQEIRLLQHCFANWSAFDMTDFYEELADFAAMSEDDGFLGQCAGEVADLPGASTVMATSGECGIAPVRQHPQQLRLLVVLERSTKTL